MLRHVVGFLPGHAESGHRYAAVGAYGFDLCAGAMHYGLTKEAAADPGIHAQKHVLFVDKDEARSGVVCCGRGVYEHGCCFG